MRISILWSQLARYSVSFFQQLTSSYACDVQLVYETVSAAAPYAAFDLSFCRDRIEFGETPVLEIQQRVESFRPDCILLGGWNNSSYMKIARRARHRGSRVVCALDNPWEGTLRQRLGAIVARPFLQATVDAMFAAGERQAAFAHRLGYLNPWLGCYAADSASTEVAAQTQRPRAFLFVGRLSPEKGLPELIDAFRAYCSISAAPAELLVAGTGPLESIVHGQPGIQYLGFVQPGKLSELYARAWCLILPSRREPWGVVIQEAAAAGLPIIATDRCGATTWFLRDGANGFLIAPGTEELLDSMVQFEQLTDQRREEMSTVSRQLAGSWTTHHQANYFMRKVAGLLKKEPHAFVSVN